MERSNTNGTHSACFSCFSFAGHNLDPSGTSSTIKLLRHQLPILPPPVCFGLFSFQTYRLNPQKNAAFTPGTLSRHARGLHLPRGLVSAPTRLQAPLHSAAGGSPMPDSDCFRAPGSQATSYQPSLGFWVPERTRSLAEGLLLNECPDAPPPMSWSTPSEPPHPSLFPKKGECWLFKGVSLVVWRFQLVKGREQNLWGQEATHLPTEAEIS
ncbi:uncharacterized protein LOC129400055 [Sorex araneus]|uniref:uncharacterized protein LOC129400055 n=1 Tax=Sorex araneus TaxID=42254 RepID=UPI002433D433|nr:uncharacterized protein LOC129400055 [Sorex araneus]